MPLPLTNPQHGTIKQARAGVAVYTPFAGFSGSDSFTYAVSDGTTAPRRPTSPST